MQKVARKTNWEIQFLPELDASVPSFSPSGWSHFISQRKRHISGAKYFSLPIQLGYVCYFFSKLLIMAVFIISIVINAGYNLAVILLFSYLSTAVLMYVMARKTKQIHLLIFYPVWEIYYLISHIVLGPLGLFGKISWGGRHAE